MRSKAVGWLGEAAAAATAGVEEAVMVMRFGEEGIGLQKEVGEY